MERNETKGKAVAQAARGKRLASALKANLLRRKAQARGRAAAQDVDATGEKPAREGDDRR